MTETVRVRFAPSPTGYLHIGGARTALFNWLYARRAGGEFVLRIEDTDLTRSEERFTEEILESLKWMGLDWNDAPVRQSSRFELYRSYARRLVEQGAAYESGGAVIFRVPPQTVGLDDLVFGRLEFDNSLLPELVIIKSDGAPTYNFACVVDDATMGISCIIRGDDHISNTPKQIPLYQALGFALPKFAHVPMILGPDGKRLSKRHGATSVLQYRELGYLPEALVNFLALLGWSPGEDLEMMELDELIRRFSLDGVNRKSAVFNLEKLTWMNGQYIRKTGAGRLIRELAPRIRARFSSEPSREYLDGLLQLYRERFRTLAEFPDETRYFFEEEFPRDPEAVEKHLANGAAKERLRLLRGRIAALETFDAAGIETAVRGLAAEMGIKAGHLIHPARVALTGKSVSPGLFEVMHLLGKERVLKRLERAAE